MFSLGLEKKKEKKEKKTGRKTWPCISGDSSYLPGVEAAWTEGVNHFNITNVLQLCPYQ